jgi:crotonobetainyl-CoA:carnitine CoA-transferase CaiB-like acyl-CoA transferase
MAGPLAGIKILDLSIAVTGPMAVCILADQGASVIKVEQPGLGDIARWVGVSVNGIGAMFQMSNRGKRSIAVNLHSDEGRDIVRKLARDVDVVVQNFRPGVVDRLGIGYEDVRSGNEDVIYMSISGFGPNGPYANKKAYDPVVQCYGGMAATQSEPDGGKPTLLYQAAADKVTSLYASQAITAALFARDRGSGSQHIVLPMLDAVVNFVWTDAAGNEVMLDSDGSQKSSFSQGQPLFHYSDGAGIAAPVSDADFAGICRAMNVEGYDDPRVATIAERWQNPELTTELMEKCYANALSMTTSGATSRLEDENTPCGVVLSTAELHEDRHVREVGLLKDSEHPVGGKMRQPIPPAKFSATPAQLGSPCPTLGQHTDEVLGELGLADQTSRLREAGVVA